MTECLFQCHGQNEKCLCCLVSVTKVHSDDKACQTTLSGRPHKHKQIVNARPPPDKTELHQTSDDEDDSDDDLPNSLSDDTDSESDSENDNNEDQSQSSEKNKESVSVRRNRRKRRTSRKRTSQKKTKKHAHASTMNANEAHDLWGHEEINIIKKTARKLNVKLIGRKITCEGCAKAKAKAKSVKSETAKKADKPGERSFIDLSGPYAKSFGNNRHWGKMVDDYSGMSWDDFVKNKNDFPGLIDN